jgi:hypothetical protein
MLLVNAGTKRFAQEWMDEIRDVDWGDDSDPRGFVTEDNLNDYLVDEIEQDQNTEDPSTFPGRHPVPTTVDDIREEIPTANELLGVPKDTQEITYASPQALLYDAMDSTEVVSFEYTNRHGNYSGLRTVEPHYTFVAQTTGNEVVVTFDRDVNDIRAFIVGNIHPGGVRYNKINFIPRPDIMRGVY